ncbi:DNA repair protein RecO [Synechocystis sp. LKSZ1]|uniref:DNA repair protein RecO n=1 Tax=Synechocystis sp. LKSZ1 TaxID=3144951 RepID=UPI00336BB5E8
MSRCYDVTGIILKSLPLGEADRLLTILSPERGLMRVVAPGARQGKSPLRGRCEIFATNQFHLSQGRSLARILHIDSLQSPPHLSQDVGKLAAGQYLVEVVLRLGSENQAQTDLYNLLQEHLQRLARLHPEQSLHAYLAQALFHLLALEGFAPQVHHCCVSQKPITPDFIDSHWRIGFSAEQGGLIELPVPGRVAKINALTLMLLQHLAEPTLPDPQQILPPTLARAFRDKYWIDLEHLLRDYAQHHLDHRFKAAALLDTLVDLAF